MNTYICNCGKTFDNIHSFAGHRGHCKAFLNTKDENAYDDYQKKHEKKLADMRIKAAEKRRSKKEESIKQEASNLAKWISEQHRCEKCGKVMTERYASGRFCSKACAHSREHSEESRERVRESLFRTRGVKYKKRPICSNCGKILLITRIHQMCRYCLSHTEAGKNILKEAARKGTETKRAKNSFSCWKSRNISSYPESFFEKVLKNEAIEFVREFKVPRPNKSGAYFLDFYLTKDSRKIDLEIDGLQHTQEQNILKDQERDNFLKAEGYDVYRIPWNEINSEEGKEKIKQKIDMFLDFYRSL